MSVYQDLGQAYQFHVFDYVKASQSYRAMALSLDRIPREERLYPTYFRVAMFGEGFPEKLRNKAFVYRSGHEGNLETVMEFTNRIKSCFPSARVVNTADPPPQEVLEISFPGQYIQITTLTPSNKFELACVKNQDVFDEVDMSPVLFVPISDLE